MAGQPQLAPSGSQADPTAQAPPPLSRPSRQARAGRTDEHASGISCPMPYDPTVFTTHYTLADSYIGYHVRDTCLVPSTVDFMYATDRHSGTAFVLRVSQHPKGLKHMTERAWLYGWHVYLHRSIICQHDVIRSLKRHRSAKWISAGGRQPVSKCPKYCDAAYLGILHWLLIAFAEIVSEANAHSGAVPSLSQCGPFALI